MDGIFVYQLFECITVVFETFIVYQYINGLFKKRDEQKSTLPWYILFCTGLIPLSLFRLSGIILTAYTLAALSVLVLIVYKTKALYNIFSVCYFAAIMMASELLTAGIVSGIWKIDFPDMFEYGVIRLLCILVSKLIQIFLVKVSVYIVNLKTRASSGIDLKIMLPLLGCQFFSICIVYYIATIWLRMDNEFETIAMLVVIGIIYINIIIFWYFDRIKAVFMYKSMNEASEYKLELQKQYYEQLREHQQETDALRHDMKKHINLMKALVAGEQNNLSSEYIDELEAVINDNISIVRTEYPVLSALLTEQANRAGKKGIAFDVDIMLESELKVEPVDLCIMLGNLFDNAFEACIALPPEACKQIGISIYQRNNAITIDFENTYITAEKASHTAIGKHGIGLKNVRKAAEKYGGYVSISSNDGIYKVKILVP